MALKTNGHKFFISDNLIKLMIAIFFVFFVADRAYSIIMSLRVPFVFTERGAWADPNVIKIGEPLRAHYSFYRYFYCSTDLNRFVENTMSGDIVWRHREPSGATALGMVNVSNPVFFNPPIPAGQYTLRTITYSVCSNGTHVTSAPDIHFTITE